MDPNRRQTPDKKLAKSINDRRKAFRYVNFDQAFQTLIEMQNKFDDRRRRITGQGTWRNSYTAMLQFYVRVYDLAFREREYIRQQAQRLFEEYKGQGGELDDWLIATGIRIYEESYTEVHLLYEEAKRLNQVDERVCYYYCKALINYHQKYEEAEQEFKYYLANLKPKDIEQLRFIYDTFIAHHVDSENYEQAMNFFKAALERGCYKNNCLGVCCEQQYAKLDFHLHNGPRKKGGVTIQVAKVAVLYAIEQYREQGIHLKVQMITGGTHETKGMKLEDEIPKFLRSFYPDVNCEWHNKLYMFTISFPQVRQIQYEYEKQKIKNSNTLPQEKALSQQWALRNRRADIRRDREGQYKQFLPPQEIPQEFDTESRQLAKDGLKQLGSYDQNAVECFRNLITRNPQSSWAYEHLGLAMHRLDDFAEAIQCYEKASKLTTNGKQLAEIYRKLGWEYDRMTFRTRDKSWLEKAIEYYQIAIKEDPTNSEIYHNWGIALVKLERPDEAAEFFLKVKKQNTKHDEVCIRLGNIYLNKSEYTKAEEYYQEALKRNPNSDFAYARYGELYWKKYQESKELNDLNQAKDYFARAKQINPYNDQTEKKLKQIEDEEKLIDSQNEQMIKLNS